MGDNNDTAYITDALSDNVIMVLGHAYGYYIFTSHSLHMDLFCMLMH